MSLDFKLSNLLGTVYRQGNLLFTPDGTSILSPVGNRVSCFDLVNSSSFTFTYEHRKNISRIALNPQATLMLTVDEDGRGILVNFVRRTTIHHFNFKERVSDIQFSPDGRHFAVAAGRHIQVWKTPNRNDDRQFAPFVRHRIYTGHYADVTSITWSNDSRFFLTCSKDLTARVYSLIATDSSAATILAGHKDSVISAFFSQDQETIYTVSKDGALFEWKYISKPKRLGGSTQSKEEAEDEEQDEETDLDANGNPIEYKFRWRIVNKHFFMQDNAKVRCAAFHAPTNLLVVGFSTGIFGLYELPEFTNLQILNISQNDIDFVTINKTGEWLAFGASKLGQLLVWEWQSESYIIKQQGHYDAMNSLVYSPDGSKIVTASDDGKIKVWDAISGFAIVTFTEHTSAVTSLQFSKKGSVLFSASLDGSIRAWDLIRYRNFRTFTSPHRIQFTSLAIDPSGEVVCAGSLDDFDIHLWSVQTSQLLDRLSGHQGPVSSLCFGNEGGLLVSGSWDKTVRIWSIFGRTSNVEPLQLQSEVMSVAMRPDSKRVAVATTDGQLSFWDPELGKQVGNIDGREDIAGGRHLTDRFSAANSQRSKHFTTLCYSADGSSILAGGNSKYIALYDVANEVLLTRFTISRNMAIDGTVDQLNSKNMTESGPLGLIDTSGEASDLEDRIDNTLPGATRGDASVRKVRPAIRTTSIQFSPTGRSFAAASTEGLLLYSVDELLIFDPFDLDIDVTVDTTLEKLAEKDYLIALVMAFRLGERSIIHQVYESIPFQDIELISRDLPQVYLERLLRFISSISEESPHIEFNLLWIQHLITYHGRFMVQRRHEFASAMRGLQKFVSRIGKDIIKLSRTNIYLIRYLTGGVATIDSSLLEGMDVDSDEQENREVVPTNSMGVEHEEDEDEDEEDGWFGPESRTEGINGKSATSGSDDEGVSEAEEDE
ncbi:Pwp2p [Sugiyamaella lignohabitans]|uniref:Pwp2p n=1 Tax=Sugiyamaella lignohabitans TaxID=796027 RepID=A0A167E655_9ASCO|nr:Pwp2p [Sugiyamaella lignohabitans]ANB13690.1 Pwp2p [Sugiyamaella lignohabitans]